MDSGLLEMRILNASDKAAEARYRVVELEKTVSELCKKVSELEKALKDNNAA